MHSSDQEHRAEFRFGLWRMGVALALLYFFYNFVQVGPAARAILASDAGWKILAANYLPVAGAIFSAFFLLGIFARPAAVGALLALNGSLLLLPIITELHYPYFSLTLGVYALFSPRPWLCGRPAWREQNLTGREIWYLPLFYSVFLGFTLMGVYKAFFPYWWDGGPIQRICPVGPAGTHLPVVCGWLPNRAIAYFVIFAEGISLPLALFSRTRALAWWLNVFLHLGISQFYYVRRVTIGTLLVLWFLFDDSWIPQGVWPRSRTKSPT